jgi:hypothetical protein
MRITGDDLRDGDEFEFTNKPSNLASALFIAITDDEVIATREFSALGRLPDKTPVIANWHGQHRTDGFLTTVGELKKKAAQYAGPGKRL